MVTDNREPLAEKLQRAFDGMGLLLKSQLPDETREVLLELAQGIDRHCAEVEQLRSAVNQLQHRTSGENNV